MGSPDHLNVTYTICTSTRQRKLNPIEFYVTCRRACAHTHINDLPHGFLHGRIP